MHNIITPLLLPVVALVGWSLVMLVWLAVARSRGLKASGISISSRRGGRGQDLEGKVPAEANWPGHNYAHLMEQPTLFYAIMLVLALAGFAHPVNIVLAWGYVVLRVVHSLVQATSNIVRVRFALFALSTLCLLGLTLHAAIFLVHHG